ncbi:laccase-7-like [Juglans microcarpa x Juglans regia]|uniref:laccase-7-like n=1 Tax=Juglans microcarpa x Juglans regia TaxID=2249226 RepID=UPI001B7E7A66|nr:laccase-7-like [Juglans microcarpa x Juglans regia]
MGARFQFFLACALALLASSIISAAVMEHTFHVQSLTVQRLCREQVITAVNGSLPGPEIRVQDGDDLVVHVVNKSPYNITIHWHGVFQLLSAWADGPAYVTQCPIRPGQTYAYKFKITRQEGTLWWHAHVSWLRATVYGALIVTPRLGPTLFPFRKPYQDVSILLGEWWNANVVDVENQGLALGAPPNISDAYTINGQPGDLYSCSKENTYKLTVVEGKTYMLRIINAALNNQMFFKIANHTMEVVAIDASYTMPYVTDVVVLAPGQTTDVLLVANQTVGSYYMAASPYISVQGISIPFVETATTGILVYEDATSATPLMPDLPAFDDTTTAHKFYSNLTGLVSWPTWVSVPKEVGVEMFMTFGLNLAPCGGGDTCAGPFGQRISASMNNESFELPSRLSMLEAFFNKVGGIYTTDFPSKPPVVFNYTDPSISFDQSLLFAPKSTKVKKLKYNSVVQIVLQNTALIARENHPIHLHGFNFHVLAQGFGNYDPVNDRKKFNLFNPQIRNTIAVPTGGWAVIRFKANNPGIWMAHCHLDVHLPWGLGMAFEVENGPTLPSRLPQPPVDLPQC